MVEGKWMEGLDTRAEHLISTWYRRRPLLETDFRQVDIDHLGLEADWNRPDLVRWGFALFEALAARVRQAERGEVALLVIPLEYTTDVASSAPDLAELLDEPWTRLPVPGLYVLGSRQLLAEESSTEVRIPVTGPGVASGVDYYLRCWRVASGEFANALYLVWPGAADNDPTALR